MWDVEELTFLINWIERLRVWISWILICYIFYHTFVLQFIINGNIEIYYILFMPNVHCTYIWYIVKSLQGLRAKFLKGLFKRHDRIHFNLEKKNIFNKSVKHSNMVWLNNYIDWSDNKKGKIILEKYLIWPFATNTFCKHRPQLSTK